MKYNIWYLEGYAGWSDYDGPQDVNYREKFVMNASCTKSEVISLFYGRHKNERCRAIHSCEIIKSGEIKY